MATKWHVGQDVFVVRGNGKSTYRAYIQKVGRIYGVAKWGDWRGDSCEFVLETGRERDEGNLFANGNGHTVYSDKSIYDEECRQKRAVDDLARIFGISAYSVSYAKLSPACIDELLAVIEKHKTERA